MVGFVKVTMIVEEDVLLPSFIELSRIVRFSLVKSDITKGPAIEIIYDVGANIGTPKEQNEPWIHVVADDAKGKAFMGILKQKGLILELTEN
jgi:hypothetical protein